MPDSIHFNGTTYNSLEEMPPDVRRMYEKLMGVLADNNQDGVPDMLEGLMGKERAQQLAQQVSTFMFNGQTYSSLEHMPPEARAQFAQFQAKFDANGNGIPDALEGRLSAQPTPPGWSTSAAAQADAAAGPAFAASSPIAPSTPSPFNQAAGSVVSPEGGDTRMRLAVLAIVGLGVMVCALAVVAVWAFMR